MLGKAQLCAVWKQAAIWPHFETLQFIGNQMMAMATKVKEAFLRSVFSFTRVAKHKQVRR